MRLSLGTLAEWSGGTLSAGADSALEVSGPSIDTRTIQKGELFVALKGENSDGHGYIRLASEKGAKAALVEREDALGGLPGIVVADTLKALGDIARAYRWNFNLIPWVAVTGTNGKSTTRRLIAHILRGRGGVCEPVKNFNNLIGMPLTILSNTEDNQFGVLEFGTNASGEIARLAEIAEPTIAVLTNVSLAHLEGLESLEGVANEKSDIFSRLPEDGVGIYPSQNDFSGLFAGKCQGKGFTFAVEAHANLVAQNLQFSESGSTFEINGVHFELPLLGKHNVSNCLAALAAVQHLGVSLEEAAERVKSVEGMPERLQMVQGKSIKIINDAYNSNPSSLHAAVRTMTSIPAQRRVAIIGDMLELGHQSEWLHSELGRWLSKMDVEVVLAVGKHTLALAESAHGQNARQEVRHFRSVQSLMGHLPKLIKTGDLVLVKGSRGMRLERAVKALQMIES